MCYLLSSISLFLIAVVVSPTSQVGYDLSEDPIEHKPIPRVKGSVKAPLTQKQEKLLITFPRPKHVLNNIYQQYASHMKQDKKNATDYMNTMEQKAPNNMWKCIINVQWPEQRTFEYTSGSKADAGNMAALDILSWLQDLGKVDSSGKLTILEKRDYVHLVRKPLAEVVIRDEHLRKIDNLFEEYMEVEGIIRRNEENPPDFDMLRDVDVLNDAAYRLRNEEWYSQRNSKLYHDYLAREEREKKKTLPIMPLREKIVNEIEKQSVVVIEGDTGCGKSTQVPQFVLDHYIKNLRASDCNIIVAQPRRISAISVAEWVAKERGEMLGESIGYHVRLNYVLPPKKSGSIIYVTAGLLLRKIVRQPELSDFSHVIVDEAHERSIDIDLLLYLLKRAISVNPKLRVVIMSATINAKLFQSYYNNAPAVFVPGFVYPVKSFFFDRDMVLKLQLRSVPKSLSDKFSASVDNDLVVRMVNWIDSHKPEGAILVFLPGWAHIKSIRNEVTKNPRFFVVCAHSKLSREEQFMIFQKPPPGQRKLILATNVAETGITIDDVTYVVDSGIHKEERMEASGYSSIGLYWVSQANVKQRQGRAGRTRPGECYHLFSQELFNSLDKFPRPEIHCVPLDKTILVCKAYTKTDEKMADFLSHLPEPPSYFAVQQAVNKLQDMAAMTKSEDLTPLGKRIYLFTLDPLLSKAVIYSVLFKCVNPVLTVATTLSSNLNIFPGIIANKEEIREVKKNYSPGSDHIATAWIHHHWENLGNHVAEQEYCYKNKLSQRSLSTVSNLRNVHRDYLIDVKMVQPMSNCLSLQAPINTFARSDELVKSVLLAGLNNLLVVRDFHYVKGRLKVTPSFANDAGSLIFLMQDSVNSKRSSFPVPFMTYFDNHRSLERRAIVVYDTSLVSPVAVLLFYGKDFMLKPYQLDLPEGYIQLGLDLSSHNPVNIVGSRETLEKLKKLKKIMWDIMDYLVQHTGYSEETEDFNKVTSFRDKLVHVVTVLLDEEGARIDYDEKGKLRV